MIVEMSLVSLQLLLWFSQLALPKLTYLSPVWAKLATLKLALQTTWQFAQVST
jgi:hypothetical protein